MIDTTDCIILLWVPGIVNKGTISRVCQGVDWQVRWYLVEAAVTVLKIENLPQKFRRSLIAIHLIYGDL